MIFEYVNAGFEAVGAYYAWMNVTKLVDDNFEAKGVSMSMFVFSSAWSLFCIPYYLSVGHGACAFFAAIRCMGLAAWVLAVNLHKAR